MDSLSSQLYAFAIVLLAGASIGLIFDLYRLLRSWLRPGCVATAVMDLFFWLVAAPVIIAYILAANWGELRLYVLIALILGLAFYYLIFSKAIIRLMMGLAHIISHIISFIMQIIFNIILLPVKALQDLKLTVVTKRRGYSKWWRFKPRLRWKVPVLEIFRRKYR